MSGGVEEKQMRLRYRGSCRVCGAELPAKSEVIYERTTKTVRCVSHDASQPVVAEGEEAGSNGPAVLGPSTIQAPDSGVAGASARREFERRKAQREERIRAKHPRLGGLLLAISDDPQSTAAWNVGARGEERLGKGLDRLASGSLRLLQ